jgi:hypothetical protein
VVILIDIGSKHSFVKQNVAKKIQLLAHEGSKLTVMVANGDTISCLGCCKAVSFSSMVQFPNYSTSFNFSRMSYGVGSGLAKHSM